MDTTKTLKASTTHNWEKYTFTEEEFTASYNEFDNTWSISHPVLGCSKGRDTPEESLRNVLYEHGCTNIVVIDLTNENETAITETSTTKKGFNTMSTWNVKTANKFLRSIEKQASVNAEKFVNEHALEIAQLFIDETKESEKPWPLGSMTVGKINKSQVLTDLFVMVSDSHRSDTIRDVKFVYENFDAIQDFIINEKKGKWISVTNIRKAFAEKDKPVKDTGEGAGEDTGEDAGEEGVPLVKDVAYFADKLARLISEAKGEGIVFKDVIGYTKQMSNVA